MEKRDERQELFGGVPAARILGGGRNPSNGLTRAALSVDFVLLPPVSESSTRSKKQLVLGSKFLRSGGYRPIGYLWSSSEVWTNSPTRHYDGAKNTGVIRSILQAGGKVMEAPPWA